MLASQYTQALHLAGFKWKKIDAGQTLPNKIVIYEPAIAVILDEDTFSSIKLTDIGEMSSDQMQNEIQKYRDRVNLKSDFDALPEKG